MNSQLASSLPIDLNEQALLYTALFENFYSVPWLKGIFIWSWPVRGDQQGPSDSSFSPQGKPAQGVLSNWYHENWDLARVSEAFSFPNGNVSVPVRKPNLNNAGTNPG